jgi:Flp pilus assembly pilin Flp
MVEYALLLVAVLILSAVAFKSLGEKIKTSVNGTAAVF